MIEIQMWDNVPAVDGFSPVLEYYPAEKKKTDATVISLPVDEVAGLNKYESLSL